MAREMRDRPDGSLTGFLAGWSGRAAGAGESGEFRSGYQDGEAHRKYRGFGQGLDYEVFQLARTYRDEPDALIPPVEGADDLDEYQRAGLIPPDAKLADFLPAGEGR